MRSRCGLRAVLMQRRDRGVLLVFRLHMVILLGEVARLVVTLFIFFLVLLDCDLLLSGRIFTGAETADWGLWNGVAPDGDGAVAMAREWATAVATGAGPNAVRVTKAQVYGDLVSHAVGDSVDESVRLIDEATKTAEYREGVAALREKRPPRF